MHIEELTRNEPLQAKQASATDGHFISVIVPMYDEDENVFPLCEKIREVLDHYRADFEVVLVNDGSKDDTADQLEKFATEDKRFKVIHFKRNYGQTAAMMAGIDFARGDILVPSRWRFTE